MAKKKSKKELNSLNETGKRKGKDRRSADPKAAAEFTGKERRKVKRRRQIDPTTCEREYTDQEIEFMAAMDEYKRASGRMFPTCSEILEVLANLGYRQIAESQPIYSPEGEDSKNENSEESMDEMEEQLS